MMEMDAAEPRTPEEKLQDHLMELRYLFNRHMPFFGHLVNSVPVHIASVGTASCTDKGALGEVNIDPDWTYSFTRGQVGAVWLHEIKHLALGYFARLGDKDEDDFNSAHDHAVNWSIEAFRASSANSLLGLEWPTGEDAPLLGYEYREMIAEEIYDHIRSDRAKKNDASGANGPGKEGGAGGGTPEDGANTRGQEAEGDSTDSAGRQSRGNGAPTERNGHGGSGDTKSGGANPGNGKSKGQSGSSGGRGGGLGYRDRTDCIRSGSGGSESLGRGSAREQERRERQAERWERLLQEALTIQEQRGIGSLPGAYEEIIRKLLKPRVNWFEQLMHEVQGCVKGGGLSYHRLSRRSETLGIAMPGRSRRRPRVCSAWDTSGSISSKAAANFAGAFRQIGDLLDSEMRVIQIDVSVTSDEVIDDFDAMEFSGISFKGRGGTNFDMLPEYLESSEEEVPDLLLLFTDGEVSWCDHDLWPCPVIVVTTGILAPAPYVTVKLELAS